MSWMPIIFAVVALIYASVGFGGGSTYTALLALADTNYQLLPIVSLTCNLLVVTGGVVHFSRAGTIPWGRALPICALSVPLAWLGGRIAVPETIFIVLLASSLLVAAVLLFVDGRQRNQTHIPARTQTHALEIIIGGTIGFLSGLVGIGGGIFLSPILLLLNWATARAVAGTAALFILVNSIAGMIGQYQKLGPERVTDITAFWPLFLGVIIGGQIGSRLGAGIMPERWMRRVTAVLIFSVALRLFYRLFAQ